MTPASRVLRGSASNVIRLAFTTLAGLAVPPVLTRFLSTSEYGVWVLILQISIYVGLLDLGLQSVVARFIAEHDARNDREAASRVLAGATAILACSAAIGAVVIGVLVVEVPAVFSTIPSSLDSAAQAGLLVVGISSALVLPFGPFLSAFSGLQTYAFPTVLTVGSRIASAALMILVAVVGGGIVQLAIAVAVVNVATAVAQYAGWRRTLAHRFAEGRVRADRRTIGELLSSGGVIALWTVGGLFVSGLDTVIVGRFDFAQTGAYAIATSAVNFLLLLLTSIFNPLLPSVAAVHGEDAAERVGRVALTASRYCTTLICLLGSVLVVFAYPLLELWVGQRYAESGAPLLQLLVIGNCVRQLGYPYSVVVIARGKQNYATIATVSEAAVNFAASIVLAQTLGAAGVAVGTIIGAAVSILLHLILSMRLTRRTIAMRRRDFLAQSVLRPALCAAPVLLVVPDYLARSALPAAIPVLALWLGLTVVALWFAALTAPDRSRARRAVTRRTIGAPNV